MTSVGAVIVDGLVQHIKGISDIIVEVSVTL